MNMKSEMKRMAKKLSDKSARYESALRQIVRKVPESVSREEAADMACEFKILAQKALASTAGGQDE